MTLIRLDFTKISNKMNLELMKTYSAFSNLAL